MTDISYSEAIKDVRKRVSASRSSFTAGMISLPKPRREAMFALYAFCREVDDIVDDIASIELRKKGLEDWRLYISDLFKRKKASNSITAALAPAIERYSLIEEDFQAIIDGMEMDASDPVCAPSMEILDLYCDRVASAVGRVSVRIFGDSSADAMKVAHHLGRALQLTNILRDLYEDAERGRLYLPSELLDKHNISSRIPKEILNDPGIKPVCRGLASVAGDHFLKADDAMKKCPSSAMRPAKIMRAYYGAIHKQLIVRDWNDLSARVNLTKWQKALLMLTGFLGL